MSGLEAVGAAAAVVQVADTGLRLSQALVKYIEDTKTAEKRLSQFAQEVKRTAEIIKSVADLLKDAKVSRQIASQGLETAHKCVKDCDSAFFDIELFIEEARKRGKWRFTFKEPKLLLLDARLEKLKSNLGLILLVIGKAKELKAAIENEAVSDIRYSPYQNDCH